MISPTTVVDPKVAPSEDRRVTPALWAWFLVTIVSRSVLGGLLCLLAWASLPVLIGWTATTVQTGSMQPRIMVGDVVVAMPFDAEAIKAGQVVLADRPGGDEGLLLHRVSERGPDGHLVTKGDANRDTDRRTVAPDAVHGVGVLRVPWIGLPVVWLREGAAVPLVIAGLTLAGLAHAGRVGRNRLDEAGRGIEELAGLSNGCREANARRQVVTVTVVGALVGALLVTATAFAAYSSAADSSAEWIADTEFDCFDSMADSPVHHYGFSEAAGVLARDTGTGGRDGTFNGTASRQRGGCVTNPFLSLTGYGHAWTTASEAAPPVFTIEAWISTSQARGKIIGFGDRQTGLSTNNDRHLYVTRTGAIGFGVYDKPRNRAVSVVSATVITDGSWHHVAATLSEDGMRLYVDGSLAGSDAHAQAPAYAGFWRLGYDRMASSWVDAPSDVAFVGDIDSVSVYDRALSAEQLRAHALGGR